MMKVEITDEMYEKMGEVYREMYPGDPPEGPSPEFLARCDEIIGKELMGEAYKREQGGEQIELVRVKVKSPPKAKPKLPESVRRRLIAEGKLKDE